MNDLYNLIILPVFGVLIWIIKYITTEHKKSLERLIEALKELSDNVAYCPYRNEIEKKIKKPIAS